MQQNKSKLLVVLIVALCTNSVTFIAYADDNKTSTDDTNKSIINLVENNDKTHNNTELKINYEFKGKDDSKNEYEIENNWLTEEVAKQLNKSVNDLMKDDFTKITKIDLKYDKIDNEIPKEISLMINLEYLDLNYCKVYGDIPESIANLPKLNHLDLGDNKINSIPDKLKLNISNGRYMYCDIEGNDFKLDEGWYYLKGKLYYFDRWGDKLKGEQTVDGVDYSFTEEGYIREGFEQNEDNRYYYDRKNGMIKNQWKFINNSWYYFNEEGIMQTGLKNIKGTYFYLAPNGIMLTGIQNIDGNIYYFASTGGMQYGWLNIDDKRYYFNETTGIMVVNEERIINGAKYKFLSDGSLITNSWIDQYNYIQPNGQAVNTYYSYSHSNTNYQLFKYMTDTNNRINVHYKAIDLHGGITANNCVYFTSEALRRVGVGLSEDTCNTYQLEDKLTDMGFVACYDLSQLKPGDIVFTNNYTHVYVFMCWDTNGDAYIVDNQADSFDNKILHLRQVYNDTQVTDRATHFYYYPN